MPQTAPLPISSTSKLPALNSICAASMISDPLDYKCKEDSDFRSNTSPSTCDMFKFIALAFVLSVLQNSLASPTWVERRFTSDTDIEMCLNAHNTVRSRHGAAPLIWSTNLAAEAQDWADGCQFTHSSPGGTSLSVLFLIFFFNIILQKTWRWAPATLPSKTLWTFGLLKFVSFI